MRALPRLARAIARNLVSAALILPRAALGGVDLARQEARDDAALRAMHAARGLGRDLGASASPDSSSEAA